MKYIKKGNHCEDNFILVKNGDRELVTLEIESNSLIRIKVEKNSNLLLTSLAKSYITNLEFDVELEGNAMLVFTLNFGSLSELSDLKINFKTKNNSILVINTLIDNYGKINFDLSGEIGGDCESYFNNLISTGTRKIDSKIHINVTHTGSHSLNEINLNGVINSNSFCDFTGEIVIPQNLKGITSDMYSKFLCYEGAKIYTLPILKINSNEVKTSHGVSVINVDSQKIEYLMSRGLSEEEANELLKVGSLSEMLDKMANSFKKSGVSFE